MVNVDLSGVNWFKSSYSEGSGQCVEVAWLDGGSIGVRDSKDQTGPALIFTPSDWDAFTAGVKDGEFTRPTT
ncbi:DUF397 domain-containing protein [Nocardia sp. CA-084685]|uniref:DUF397 domain-containing protein n=1 Tax=Nocardia sp. CA-084685 TaxID=3239970 RepID=UPI003D971B99